MYNATESPVLILSHSVPCPVTIHVSDQNITANELSILEGLYHVKLFSSCVVTEADTVGPQLSKYLCVTSMLEVFR